MSEPITLTKRERAVFESLIKYVRGRCANWVSRGDDAPTATPQRTDKRNCAPASGVGYQHRPAWFTLG